MSNLDENWLTKGLFDFEYKKYILLAYLKTVRENFNDKKLFPYMSDLIFHYRNLQMIKEKKEILHENFPKSISKADFEHLRITYKKLVNDDEVMSELTEIVNFASKNIKSSLEEGKELYEFLEKQIEIMPVGLTPINNSEGYLFISERKNKEFRVFRYLITIFENSIDKYRGVNFQYLGVFRKKLTETYESIKQGLIRSYQELPNPATFLMLSELHIPYEETYLPIAKRMLVKYVENKPG